MQSEFCLLLPGFDSAEPFGPELTADGMVAGCPLNLDIPKPEIFNLLKI